MYFLFILFFVSLISIAIMIGRKLASARNGEITEQKHSHPFVPNLQKIKHLVFENTKKYGHLSVVAILRFYIRFSNFLKYKYEEIKIKIKNANTKNHANGDLSEKVEVSKFLKIISDYKNKIKEIKHKIREEENNS
ncbi:hypothetical protein A3B85_00205 [Candidatus Nomurabacteria bacterium RIFCSPHIGHO2_02_FULL_37_13]|uniref:Uncharacterized protein n=1 Tax=Candidatus Nomurabacteria bacterium RIFCSPHIGHO2_02_FULL_37_13 TaxID=1801750 RepID=A0A1F6W4E6_9BACT|nr:MAG: hypothetical protein A2640_03075 [Candidatus Nomurabacteria bacterium RIFCSPHIGHO2_01_FULL_36_23]OGI76682.1 MAG: hypothetical protein A3B85_00205 [Candidatus Nomurabacteria bacterium RIFCSPHIGHO2_02_FULL_37_13]OGI86934.1 MAG: hypothetical protein A2906_00390 [Candidatus Nomurabacteria bacterium RIFCSPLOWO2_01_FULL_37_25]